MSGAGGLLALPGLLAALCWACLLARIGPLAPASARAAALAPPGAPYRAHELALLFALWLLVFAALLLPAAAPQALLHARVRRQRDGRRALPASAMFLLGHLLAWSAYAAVATLASWLLHDAGALDEAMAVAHPGAGALALVAAGVYQWTPAKHACLETCRAPLAFVLTHWRGGVRGALRMGVADARYCAGCCWLLLALLVPAGVAGLPVAGAVAVVLLAEKLLPGGHIIACATGLGLLAWGTALLFP